MHIVNCGTLDIPKYFALSFARRSGSRLAVVPKSFKAGGEY